MRNNTTGKPGKRSRPRSILGLVLAVVGLWFGFAILNITGETALGGGEKALRIVFGIVWFTFWIGAMIYNVMNLYSSSRTRKPDAASAASPAPEAAAGFEAKLRGLEALKKDGLLSEEEYRRKRDELLREKW